VVTSLGNVHRLGRKKLLGLALNGSQALAFAAGMGDIHRFLRLATWPSSRCATSPVC
jgi:hypothetical protein